jgi:hypothetical protein
MTINDLLATATLGTERAPVAIASAPGRLGELLAQLTNQPPEQALLTAAALLTTYRRAGQPPLTLAAGESPFHPLTLTSARLRPEHLVERSGELSPGHSITLSPHEPQPRCSPTAAAQLTQLLDGQFAAVLPEWLALLVSSGQRTPEELLPRLLILGERQPALRDVIRQAGGERGRWLAQQNLAWGYATPIEEGEINERWQTGERSERSHLLQWLRTHQPARGLALLSATWTQETADDRLAWVSLLEYGLSLDDEPFLNTALDDRHKEVRSRAAELLTSLPTSQVSLHLQQAGLAMLRWEEAALRLTRWLGGAGHLVVELPATLDATLVRAGIDPKPLPGLGQKAGWLQQIISKIPPVTWCNAWNKRADELVTSAIQHEWKIPLLVGWMLAATRHRDELWAHALLDAHLQRAIPSEVDLPDLWTALLHTLPATTREAYTSQLLTIAPEWNAEHPAIPFLEACSHAWSVPFTRTILAVWRHHLDQHKHYSYELRTLLVTCSRFMAPELANEAEACWPAAELRHPFWSPAIDELIATLHFRQAMRDALGGQQTTHDRRPIPPLV